MFSFGKTKNKEATANSCTLAKEAVDTSLPPSEEETCSVEAIISEIAEYSKIKIDLQRLSRLVGHSITAVRNTLIKHNNIFKLVTEDEYDFVLLLPSLKICENYITSRSCAVGECSDLHICKAWIFNACTDEFCAYGHNFLSDHNIENLKKIYFGGLKNDQLYDVFKKINFPLKICARYNNNQCVYKTDCKDLHLCKEFIRNFGINNCSPKCNFSHTMLEEHCQKLLKDSGISVNQSPIELAQIIANKCGFQKKGNKKPTDNKPHHSKVDNSGDIKEQKYPAVKSKIMKEKYVATKKKAPNYKEKDQFKSVNVKGKEKVNINSGPEKGSNHSKCNPLDNTGKLKDEHKLDSLFEMNVKLEDVSDTKYAYQLDGNVRFPRICHNGIEKNCKFASKGCDYLHSELPYYWQFQSQRNWYNFTLYHVKHLQKGYENPDCETMTLSRLNKEKLNREHNVLIEFLGENDIGVNFNEMTIRCKDKNKFYQIRYLSTASSVTNNTIFSTNFGWYKMTSSGSWEYMGDALGRKIESYYCQHNNSKGPNMKYPLLQNWQLEFKSVTNSKIKCEINDSSSGVSDTLVLRRRPLIMKERDEKLQRQERDEELQRQERDEELRRQERDEELRRQERDEELRWQERDEELRRQERNEELRRQATRRKENEEECNIL